MQTFEQFKTELSNYYKEKFGDTLTITSVKPVGDVESIETELNGKKFYTFSLKVMEENWQQIRIFNDVSFVEYVATKLNKNTLV